MNKKQIIRYLKNTELNIQSANASLFACDLVFRAYANSSRVHKVNYSPVFCYLTYKQLKPFFQIISKKIINEVARKIYLDYLTNPGTLTAKIKRHKELERKLDKIWANYQKRKSILSNKEILKIYQRLIKVSRKWWYYGAISEDKGEVLELEVAPRFAKRRNIDVAEAKKIVDILSYPSRQTVFNIERRDFLNICLYVLENTKLRNRLKENNFVAFLKDKMLNQKIKKYIQKHFWFKTDFYKAEEITPALLFKNILQEIAKNKKSKILKELRNINRGFQKIKKQKDRLLMTLKLTKEDKKDIRFAQLIIYWIDQRKIGTMKQFYYFFSFIEEIAENFSLKYHNLAIYTVDELESFLAKKKRIGKKEVDSRNRGVFCVFERDKKVKMFYGEEGKKMFKIATFLGRQKEKGLKETRGKVASTGGVKKIKGKVRIIYHPKKDRFNEGEILVTSMTRVEFIPLMRKAKAIITNEGGVACHAAIVSRELNIPCIIGTKNATDLLKNGDLVEVDAERGTVKIIKKAK